MVTKQLFRKIFKNTQDPLSKNTYNIMIRPFITKIRVIKNYGDCYITESGHCCPYRGKTIQVKLFGIFWIGYKFYPKKEPENIHKPN